MRTSGERADVKLKRQMPLYFVYITAWAPRTASCSSAATSTSATAWGRPHRPIELRSDGALTQR